MPFRMLSGGKSLLHEALLAYILESPSRSKLDKQCQTGRALQKASPRAHAHPRFENIMTLIDGLTSSGPPIDDKSIRVAVAEFL